MKLFKVHGLGNDFLLYEGNPLLLQMEFIRELCHRRLGVGADGFIYLDKAKNIPKMTFYNADGAKASFCGNAMRALFLHLNQKQAVIESPVGPIRGRVNGPLIDVCMPEPEYVVSHKSSICPYDHYRCGVDHALVQCTDLCKDYDPNHSLWENIASYKNTIRKMRWHCDCNITAFRKVSGSIFDLITFEKGVEDFTLACGSAAACMAKKVMQGEPRACMRMQGGNLEFFRENKALWMRGEAKRVATIEIDENFTANYHNSFNKNNWSIQ